ncbi:MULTISPECIES: hypothetical protein [unclassified Microcoleus]|nr:MULTISPECIES: hypothetical protein [unclassified Microcoleus]
MSSERVTSVKSLLLEGQISVKDFVREFMSPKLIGKFFLNARFGG